MTHALQIDTLEFSKKLKAAGADERLAEAIVEGLTAADTSSLATKADLAEVKSELKTDITGVKTDLLKYMIAMFVTQLTVMIALFKLLP